MAIPSPEVLRPSPLDLGATLSGAVRVLKQRLSTFVVIALLQGVLTAILVFGAVALFIVGIFSSIQQRSAAAMLILGIIAIFVATFGAFLIQIKAQSMLVLGAHDAIHGRSSSLGELFRRTAGVALRVLVLALALVAAIFVVFGAFFGLFFGVVLSAGRSSSPGDAVGAVVGVTLLFVVVMLVLGIAAVYLQIRFLYLIPALAVEDRSAIEGLKRSWALTKGNVLRTLGYYLVASLIVGAISYVVQIIPQMAMTPALQSAEQSGDGAGVFLAMLPFMAVITVLQIAVQLLATPFLASYVTVMYVDQLRRNELVNAFGAPGYGGVQPGQAPQQWGPGQQQWGPGQQQWGPGQQQWGPGQPPSGQNPYGN
ncbi:glycerophosphoryl diester phosphodiesterase membrane domain-containing protein [Granulicoccus sp. GXG6511]|uniref:glycerophosphoryl diester phosphodiesterase membrane domain-containing protein n=1 Tax=Granulicoccus sp. GXG6511 TaxID=3381351 RepID=UPI003D7DB3AC